MTPKLKVRILLITAVGIFFGLGILTNYVFPQNTFVNLVSFIISILIITWLYTQIKTKEEIKEYDEVHWKVFNGGARLFGGLALLAGVLSLLDFLFSGQTNVGDEKWVYLIIALIMLPIGYGFLVVEEYKPKDTELPDDSKSEKWCSQSDPLRKMLEEEKEKK